MIVLGVAPVDGRLTIQATTGSAVSPAFEGESDDYFVVSKAGAATAPDGLAMARIASLGRGADGGGVPPADASATCTYSSFIPTTTCWNAAKSISFTTATKLDSDWEARVSAFLDRSGAIVAKYKSLGFVRADPTPADPIRIVIDPDSGADPRYSPNLFTSPKIYVGFRTIYFIDNPGEQQLMAHELFHWVQHHTYPMRVDGNIAAKYWHSETQAEAASFMVDPAYQAARLLTVASQVQVEGTSGVLGWQKAGGEWDQDGIGRPNADPSRYVQGQVVALGLCDGPTCIESRQAFIDEVNSGGSLYSAISYPLGLENTARYLLGTAPTGVTVDLTAPILKTGRGIGDYVHLSRKPGVYSDYAVTNTPTNLKKNAESGVVDILAGISGNGLYPLRISNGSDVPLDDDCLPGSPRFSNTELNPNAPFAVHLNAGVELYWRTGNGPIQHSDGSKPLDIGPITSESSIAVQMADHTWTTMPGIPSVRIVAVNQTKDPVTLSGNVAPQAPKMVATPNNIAKADPNTPVQLRLDLTQVALSFAAATAEWDFGDGSATQPTTITPDAKLQAGLQVTHTFTGTSTGVRLTFRDKAGNSLAWDPVNIPVGAATGSGHWVLAKTDHGGLPGPASYTTDSSKLTIDSANGTIASSYQTKDQDTEGSASWGPPPASAVPGDTWDTTLSAGGTCTGVSPGIPLAAVSIKVSWWAGSEQPKEDDWDVSASCGGGPGSTKLAWVFPAHIEGTCGLGNICSVDIFEHGNAGLTESEDSWTYHYEWQP
jgi:hypothetical protein